jgi:hypothetical protein
VTDVKSDKQASEAAAADLAAMDEQIQQLADRARAEGPRLTGEGGLTGTGRKRWSNRWKKALNAFEITFDGRLSAGRK